MADLTPLDEKLGEVLGLALAAQDATEKVGGMEGAEDFESDLLRMREQAAETEQRTDALVDGLEGKKTAIRDEARETKGEAAEMMKTYLGGEEALDGFEFLSMAEAGELCHWEIVETMSHSHVHATGSRLPRKPAPPRRPAPSDPRQNLGSAGLSAHRCGVARASQTSRLRTFPPSARHGAQAWVGSQA